MSDDSTFIIRRDGEDLFFYSRYGGAGIDRVALGGLSHVRAHTNTMRPTAAPFLERFLCGLCMVDEDARVVRLWSNQPVGTTPLGQQLVLTLLRAAWPGWHVVRMHDPAGQLASVLPAHPPLCALEPPAPVTPEGFAAEQEEVWEEACATHDWSEDIAEQGEATVRRWHELSSHSGVVFIDDGSTVHEATFSDGWDAGQLLRCGPGALPALLRRHRVTLEDVLFESEIESAYWIDTTQQVVHRWAGKPRWPDHPLRLALSRWPGWRLEHTEEGVFGMLTRLGRDPMALVSPQARRQLEDMLDRRLSVPSHLQPQVESFLSRLPLSPP